MESHIFAVVVSYEAKVMMPLVLINHALCSHPKQPNYTTTIQAPKGQLEVRIRVLPGKNWGTRRDWWLAARWWHDGLEFWVWLGEGEIGGEWRNFL
ncbi:uncharacterized protein G2W53_009686 [Senna tora]|uniref:Uncharacterized protein n=1 Tax=Senna tora TaxID=362788 RepID=A0A835CD48_9FABA|nr:uncharacterized protein G2W53_009686 [Senna tora]